MSDTSIFKIKKLLAKRGFDPRTSGPVFAALYTIKVVVAEWLRRWTRNPLGSPRAASNPADYVKNVIFIFSIK